MVPHFQPRKKIKFSTNFKNRTNLKILCFLKNNFWGKIKVVWKKGWITWTCEEEGVKDNRQKDERERWTKKDKKRWKNNGWWFVFIRKTKGTCDLRPLKNKLWGTLSSWRVHKTPRNKLILRSTTMAWEMSKK